MMERTRYGQVIDRFYDGDQWWAEIWDFGASRRFSVSFGDDFGQKLEVGFVIELHFDDHQKLLTCVHVPSEKLPSTYQLIVPAPAELLQRNALPPFSNY